MISHSPEKRNNFIRPAQNIHQIPPNPPMLAADLAGTSRLAYPPNIKIVRVMCSGMVDPKYVIKAFLNGADGVLIGGCWPGDCHYINGNLKARRRVAHLTEILKQYGIGDDRFWLRWIAASEGTMLQEVAKEMTEKIKAIGPSPIKTQQEAA